MFFASHFVRHVTGVQKTTEWVKIGRKPVAHGCNPSDSGGRYQDDRGSKSAQANGSRAPISKKPFTKKKGLVEWLKV
jgi:hypothetical protein